MKHGKKYNESVKLLETGKFYDLDEAMGLAVKTATAKFDETVEIHVRLGVDSRHADQQVRGAVVLPNGTGKDVKILVIAKGDKADAATAAGADGAAGSAAGTASGSAAGSAGTEVCTPVGSAATGAIIRAISCFVNPARTSSSISLGSMFSNPFYEVV